MQAMNDVDEQAVIMKLMAGIPVKPVDDIAARARPMAEGAAIAVGLCTLNSFDPYPITYSLSNP
jgi:hypothetical protein